MKRLLLVGGGHAHIEVLRQLAQQHISDTEILLVSPGRFVAYTGMVPGYLADRYSASEMRFDLAALARSARATYLDTAVQLVDGLARIAEVEGRQIGFDACSLDIGSAPAGWNVPGVEAHAVPLRPLGNVELLRERFDAVMRMPRAASGCVVVGGGAGGVEVALALAERGRGTVRVTLVHAEDALLPGYPQRAGRLARRACDRAGVDIRTGHAVQAVGADHVVLAGGERIPSALTVWLTGAAPPPLIAHSTLPHSLSGYVEVDDFLRSSDGSPVWGAGDCITLRSHPNTPKAGVYAVRQGPVLAHNLRAFCEPDGASRRYRPQARFLSLLAVSRHRAILSWGGVALDARWAQRLKQWIDRRFVARYRVPESN
ncbi:MAG: FAD-dependent oxidoreductase [Gemmatimonadota bacterium]